MTKIYPYPIEGVIFDNDGLILDTERYYTIVLEEMTGKEFDWDIKRRLLGVSAIDEAKYLVDIFGLDEDPVHFMNRRDEKLKELFPDAKYMAGAIEIVNEIKQKARVPIAIATSCSRKNFDIKMSKKKSFYELFDSIICGDEVTACKPNPELFLKSMEKLGIKNPRNVLVFEDAPFGIKAANNAGMAAVQVPDPELPDGSNENVDAKPTLILKSLCNFDYRLFDWASK